MVEGEELVIPKVWRSELKLILVFFIACVLCIVLSRQFPGSVMTGSLISWGSWKLMLSLPLYWLIPAITLMMAVIRIYDVRYIVDGSGIETRVGILSVHQRVTRIRFEDIRSAETEQSITERMLDIGDVFIGTAAQAGIEIALEGIASPESVQDMIHKERDRRQKLLQKNVKLEGSANA
jgi:uncharacterized membrane protein YdbT with pleckstrin-like domain